MKSSIYVLLITLIACCIQSCNEDDDSGDKFANRYGVYEKPHFEFEYASDSIEIEMMQLQKKIAVKDFKAMFSAMAAEKMGAYFRGIHFKENRELLISAEVKDGTNYSIPATYDLSGNYLQITLDKNVMKNLLGDIAANIPPISFKYNVIGDQMSMYFDKVYIQVVYSMMGNQINRMIVEMMGIDFSQMPEGTETIVIEGVKTQMAEILKQIKKVEIGFILTLDEYDL